MNRLSMNNLTEPVTKDLEFQHQDPFLLYRNAKCKFELFADAAGKLVQTKG